ncbi:MAG TPA: hypothetical protein VIB39_12245 [Candidatus Angelobacter sp.]
MKRYSEAAWWNFGRFGLIVVFVVGIPWLLFRGRDGSNQGRWDGCGSEVSAEEVSPDGKWKALVFVVDCGATTTDKEMSPRVSVLRASESLSSFSDGNVFGARANEKLKRPTIRVSWTGSNELTIRYPAPASVSEKVTKYKDVTIKYVAEP